MVLLSGRSSSGERNTAGRAERDDLITGTYDRRGVALPISIRYEWLMKRWKVAISLATVGALAAPITFGTWKHQSRSVSWSPLTEKQRQEFENYCKDEIDTDRVFCKYTRIILREGGGWRFGTDIIKYLAVNLAVALAVFAGVFGLAMVIPAILLRYWKWLKT